MSKNLEQGINKEPRNLIFEWWQNLKKRKGDRADLRHAKTLDEVFFVPAYHMLYSKLHTTEWRTRQAIALIAGILARIDSNEIETSFAAQMASPGKSGRGAQVSGLRFRRLLQNKSREDIYGSLIRIIHLMGKRANVKDLSECLYWWNERTRREWAFKYYEKAPDET